MTKLIELEEEIEMKKEEIRKEVEKKVNEEAAKKIGPIEPTTENDYLVPMCTYECVYRERREEYCNWTEEYTKPEENVCKPAIRTMAEMIYNLTKRSG